MEHNDVINDSASDTDTEVSVAKAPAPLWAYAILVVAVIAMSSGGVWFALLTETPPFMQSFWRLILTAFVQFFGLIYELKTDKTLDAAFWRRYKSAIPLIAVIGIALGMHFGAWGWSVAHTSLLDSLLLVTTTPLLLVTLMSVRSLFRSLQARMAPNTTVTEQSVQLGAIVLTPRCGDGEYSLHSVDHDNYPQPFLDDGAMSIEYSACPTEKEAVAPTLFQLVCCPVKPLPPTVLEAIGAVVGFLGVVVLLVFDTSSSDAGHDPTLAGNAAALFGAATVLVYFEGGSTCRTWMPLFIYAFPVTFIASIFIGVASLSFENTTFVGLGPNALFGFLGAWDRFGLALGSALVSGIAGHTFANLAVKHVSALLISVGILWEPVIGSVIGWLVNVQGAPGASAVAATPILMVGALLVTVGGRNSGFQIGEWFKTKCCRRQ
ncbi:hypothetical protein THRCLA_04946 [Thraustotheca clavata]|uniref:Drug/Metabolite Transporter (DMT) Superfamily n=1 Tax=Thraustotheca clavata TaxID=74557 RepID=A0A1V9ZXK0_9STRA|nr:hypothetical protein THRCLA_04946 [Thraustotheca clavata]